MTHYSIFSVSCYREDVDDSWLLLLRVLAPLYHHPQLPGLPLNDLHLDQLRLRPDNTAPRLKEKS